jgi:hypothetical protein
MGYSQVRQYEMPNAPCDRAGRMKPPTEAVALDKMVRVLNVNYFTFL